MMLIRGFAWTLSQIILRFRDPQCQSLCVSVSPQPFHVLLLARAAFPSLLHFAFPSHSLCHQNPQGPAWCGSGEAAEFSRFYPSAVSILHPHLADMALISLPKHTEIQGCFFPWKRKKSRCIGAGWWKNSRGAALFAAAPARLPWARYSRQQREKEDEFVKQIKIIGSCVPFSQQGVDGSCCN